MLVSYITRLIQKTASPQALSYLLAYESHTMDSVLEDMYAHASRELAAKGEFDAEIATYDISRETRQPVTAVQRTIGMHEIGRAHV